MWIIVTIYLIGSLAIALLEFDHEQEYGSNVYEAAGRAFIVFFLWPLFRLVEAWRLYR